MDSLNDILIELSDRFDKEGKIACANAVDELINGNSLQKIAQYVGTIGYVLKQNRAMGNCIRKKRVASDKSTQEIVFECLKEYQDGQDYHDVEWTSKYAETIKQEPDTFNSVHLKYISSFSKDLNINDHIEKLKKSNDILSAHNENDTVIAEVLSHVNTLNEILQKEASTSRFKLATLQSDRNWWSRFWSPSGFNALNPFSWKSKWRERGEDLDTMKDMESVLERIMSLTTRTQQIGTSVYRLKNQVAGYLAGSTTELSPTQQENQNTAQLVVKKINEIPDPSKWSSQPDSWNRTILVVQQLKNLLQDRNIKNSYNQTHINMAIELSDEITDNINKTYEDISQLQQKMNHLRQRSPVKGREVGLNENGGTNPFGASSPANEFGALERILYKIYQNPFDKDAHFYAQKMHARLDDRLRFITTPEDLPEGTNWNESPISQIPNANSPQNQANQPNQSNRMPIDENKVNSAVKNLLNTTIPGIDDQSQKARFLAELLNKVFVTSGFNFFAENNNIFHAIRDQLINISSKHSPSQTKPATPVTPATRPSFTLDPDDLEDFDETNASTINTLIKISDTLDKVDPRISEIIDKYIEENGNGNDLPEIPSFSKLYEHKLV